MSRTASLGPQAFAGRALFPSDPYSILYRITPPSPAPIEARRIAGVSEPRVAPSAPRRPGETYARVEVALPLRRQLALAGADVGVPLDVAATLIAEATLLLESLDGRRLSRGHELLDRAARSSRVTRALSSSSADYLRALSCRSWRRHAAEVDLPVRITSRIGERPGRYLERDDLLEDAIRWETAALLCERSMANWGTDVVLGGFR